MSKVPSITSARLSPAIDRRDRERRYIITMGIRMVCFALALFLPSPWRWVFAVGAIVLPYIAVVLANVGTSRMARGVDIPLEQPALPAPANHNGPDFEDPRSNVPPAHHESTHAPPRSDQR